MKVVINGCYGGFSLSDKALEKLMDLKGITWEKGKDTFGIQSYFKAGHIGDDQYYIWYRDFIDDRSDPELIQVIEELGREANGQFSELKIIEIPDDIEFDVFERGGSEWIAEKHRTWE